jgi:peroxiredoxin Q/BCP
MQAFQADFAKFERRNAQVVGVSSDTIGTHKEFAKKYRIRYPLIADPEGRVMNLYGGQDRITFIIDKMGIVRYAVRGVPKNKELLKKLDEMEKKRP